MVALIIKQCAREILVCPVYPDTGERAPQLLNHSFVCCCPSCSHIHILMLLTSEGDARNLLRHGEGDAPFLAAIWGITDQAASIPTRRPDIALCINRQPVRHAIILRNHRKDTPIADAASCLIIIEEGDTAMTRVGMVETSSIRCEAQAV